MDSQFRTIDISDPEFESNNIRHITVKSNNLKGRGDISVYVPDGKLLRDLPVAILLHGVYGSHGSWLYHAGLHLKMNNWIESGQLKPMVLVMPSDGLWGDGSGYVQHSGLNFEKWIVDDVVDAVRELIPQVSSNSKIYITGLSMGGFGALRLGAKYPKVFNAFSGLSSITHLNQMKMFIEEDVDVLKQERSADESVFETILESRDKMGSFRFDCGLDDELLNANRVLHEQLLQNNIKHVYEEFPGGHEWGYWGEHVFKSLHFFNNY